MLKPNRLIRPLFLLFLLCLSGTALSVELQGDAVQGGLIFGQAAPGSSASLDGTPLMVSPSGHFVFGFGRDDSGSVQLEVVEPDAEPWTTTLSIAPREYNIERVDGLPPSTVNPPPEVLTRIREDSAQVAQARTRRDQRTDYAGGFIWPAQGRLSGFYGSQRILNGEPRRPHFGVDVAAPEGTLVVAPAPGIVTLSHKDMYYSGGTMIIDHGQGLSSTFLHLSELLVPAGTEVAQGDPVARIGATGRATGPHLDWRMNWLGKRVDPQPLAGEMPRATDNP